MAGNLEADVRRLARNSIAEADSTIIEVLAYLKGHRINLGKVMKATESGKPMLLYDGKKTPGSTPEEARKVVMADMESNPEKYFDRIRQYV